MKRFFFNISLSLVACFSSLQATTISLETGRRFFDKSRAVVLDEFDYIYTLNSTHLGGYFIELEDGSVWSVEEMESEAKSFYKDKGISIDHVFVEDLVLSWEPGEHLIFHKLVDRETLLVYNIERDQLLDFAPVSPPKYSSLIITSIDLNAHLIILSDGSQWTATLCPCQQWKINDPILVAKDHSFLGQSLFKDRANTHILVNLKYCECEATKGHIHPNRIGVKRI